jgi:hypothetical protein
VLVKYGMVEDGMKELCGCVDCAEPKREVQCSARFCPHHGNQKPGRSWRVRGVGDDVYRREREWEEVTGGKGSIDENDNDYGSAVLAAATERKYESKMCVPTDQGLRRALRNTWPLTKKLNGRQVCLKGFGSESWSHAVILEFLRPKRGQKENFKIKYRHTGLVGNVHLTQHSLVLASLSNQEAYKQPKGAWFVLERK